MRVGTCSEAHRSRSTNVGVRMAAGDIFAFLDDDAVPEPDWLEQLADAYEDPTVAAAGGPVFDVPLGRIEWAICTCTREGAVNTHSEPPAERYLGRGADPFLYLAGCNMSVRRSALRRAGAFNPEMPYCYEDVEVCMRLVDAGARIAWVDAALVRHERAASWLRDGETIITDPYSLMFSAAVFIEQSSPTSAPKVLSDLPPLGSPSRPSGCRRSGARGFASGSSRGSRTVSAQGGDRGRRCASAGAAAATSSRTCRRGRRDGRARRRRRPTRPSRRRHARRPGDPFLLAARTRGRPLTGRFPPRTSKAVLAEELRHEFVLFGDTRVAVRVLDGNRLPGVARVARQNHLRGSAPVAASRAPACQPRSDRRACQELQGIGGRALARYTYTCTPFPFGLSGAQGWLLAHRVPQLCGLPINAA